MGRPRSTYLALPILSKLKDKGSLPGLLRRKEPKSTEADLEHD